jgi:YjbE family integral membrane protein
VDFAGWPADLTVLAQVVMIDVALAGDNAVVVGLAVAGLPAERRRPAILLGIGGATVLRILLARRGAAPAGHHRTDTGRRAAAAVGLLADVSGVARGPARRMAARTAEKTLRQAMWQIIAADLSMSLDNVLAVAGAAHGHPWVLVTGLLFSVVLMGAAATAIARLLDRFRWIGWIGLLIVLHVAVQMIWTGGWGVFART